MDSVDNVVHIQITALYIIIWGWDIYVLTIILEFSALWQD